jgi:hypothetical protein
MSIVGAAGAIALAVSAAGAAPLSRPWDQAGFSRIVAPMVVLPDQPVAVGIGGTHIVIPAGALGIHPVVFRLLMGSDRRFQRYVPRGQILISNFAVDVTDVITGRRVLEFQKPVTYRLTGPDVSSRSVHWNAFPMRASPPQLIRNPLPATIAGHTLIHQVAGASVGRVATSPGPGA